MWDAVTTVVKMNDKAERMAATMVNQQQKIESLTERVISCATKASRRARRRHPLLGNPRVAGLFLGVAGGVLDLVAGLFDLFSGFVDGLVDLLSGALRRAFLLASA
jgi:hypothetical protein